MKPHNTLRRFSKLLSYVLGRRPYEFGLVLDENGFVSMQMLLKAIGEEKDWKFIRESHFHEILLLEPEPPIEIAGSRIRSVDRSHLPVHYDFTRSPQIALCLCQAKSPCPCS